MKEALSRRRFLGSLGALALMPLDLRRTEPALVLRNANIITVDARNPHAQAVAIADGRFLAVGSNDEIKALTTARSKSLDLEGKTVLPGFRAPQRPRGRSGDGRVREADQA